MDNAESGDDYQAFLEEIAAEKRRMRRRDLLLRVAMIALLIWFITPPMAWQPPRLGSTLAFAVGTFLAQLFVFLKWYQRLAERWLKGTTLQVCFIGFQSLVTILGCEAIYSALAWLCS